jgi:hypothetical protein
MVDMKYMKKLQKENERITEDINKICHDFKMEESRVDLWELIGDLIENELEQEELCGE